MGALQRLHDADQAVWLDFLRRGLIDHGGLERLIREDGVSGVTSNPTIFKKAIGGSTDYDDALRAIAARDAEPDAREVFYELALEDIRRACDLFLPMFEESDGRHGFVSFELEAGLAHDAGGSIRAARDLVARIDRPNVMIKVPGTPQGTRAVEQLTADGVNVNITLLFSIEAYEAVARAYVAGLERRLEAGERVDRPASVASFFVSRVDSKVDKALGEDHPLRGKAAIANAKAAYQRFHEIFSGERWDRLARAGARVQRPLWASTSTKDPAYRDVMYVEELVGRDTVNTMPEATLDAFREHGEVRPDAVEQGAGDALTLLRSLSEHGVDLDGIAAELVEEGIQAFDDDFNDLLAVITEKLADVRAGGQHVRASLGSLSDAVGRRLRQIHDDDIVERTWRHDHTVWKPDPAEITDRLGWLTVAEQMRERLDDLEAFAKQASADGFTRAVLCGMGGSSLAPEVMRHTLGAELLDLEVLDSTHPEAVQRIADGNLDHTLFLIASKSGSTIETMSQLAFFWERTGAAAERFVAITDPGSSLEQLARDRSFRAVFLNPPEIGGRYSALSLFGLVPAALLGADLRTLLSSAETMATACSGCLPCEDNPGAWLGAVMGEAARAGRDKLTLAFADDLTHLGDWIEQLVAESTGKEGRGILPVVGEQLAAPEFYGEDRLFVAVGEVDGLEGLEDAGHPVVRIDAGPEDLGAEFFRWEFATAVAGHVLGIQPFDQPNVAEAKAATKTILEGGDGEAEAGDAAHVVASLQPGDYLALLAYVDRTPEAERRLQRARHLLRDKHRVATTLGFGPRYLHSTGQLHKGGPEHGAFLQIVDDDDGADLPIPGEAFSFRELLDAQALGDLRSLQARGRRAARVTLAQLEEVAG